MLTENWGRNKTGEMRNGMAGMPNKKISRLHHFVVLVNPQNASALISLLTQPPQPGSKCVRMCCCYSINSTRLILKLNISFQPLSVFKTISGYVLQHIKSSGWFSFWFSVASLCWITWNLSFFFGVLYNIAPFGAALWLLLWEGFFCRICDVA